MPSPLPQNRLFSLLPDRRPPWGDFAVSTIIQALAVALLLWVRFLNPELLSPPQHEYHVIEVVNTPAPVNRQPQPAQNFPVTVARVESKPETLHVPTSVTKPVLDDAPAPSVDIAPRKITPLPPSPAPVMPRPIVKTNVFTTGSSAAPTIARAPSQVQTGGFGDPNGVPVRDADNSAKRVNVAQLGSFDMPSGSGSGNGTGGAKGTKGVIASSGFGDGVATGEASSRASASRGTVRQGGFGDVEVPGAPNVRSRTPELTAKVVPAEILSKPAPVYTEEARGLKIEGEVLLEVVLEASGRLHVVRLVRGLGHGLDDAAVRAAQQIRFKPALRDGEPSDSTAVVHIIFQLA